MVRLRRILAKLYIIRPMAYVARQVRKPITIPDGDRRNKETIFFPEESANKGDHPVLDRDLSLTDVFKHTPHLSPNFRGLLALNTMLCTGCRACDRNCPNKCIEMVKADPQPKHWNKRKPLYYPQMYTGRCMYCGICEEVCPFDCLHHTQGFDAASSKNEDLHHDYEKLYDLFKFYMPERYEKERQKYIEEHGKPIEENLVTETDSNTKEDESTKEE